MPSHHGYEMHDMARMLSYALGAALLVSVVSVVSVVSALPALAAQPSAELRAARLIVANMPDDRPLLIGEMHGTRETPWIAGQVAAEIAAGQPVLLGLEMPSALQGGLDRYLASDGGAAARERLLSAPWWTRKIQDGRSSRAMFDLIERLRRLRSQGLDIEPICFAGRGDYAERLLRAHEQQPARHLLVLVGNYHARITGGSDPEAMSMADELGMLQPFSLAVGARAGEAWNCMRDGCGLHEAGNGQPGADEGVTLSRFAVPEQGNWHLVVRLPRFTGSAPML